MYCWCRSDNLKFLRKMEVFVNEYGLNELISSENTECLHEGLYIPHSPIFYIQYDAQPSNHPA
jgi:hypothetical protein